MKKKFIFLMLIFSILCIGGGKINSLNAQTVTVGSGDGNSNQFPIYAGTYEYSFTQQIYKASEINHAAGTITSIAFKPYYDIEANRNLIVYLKNVEDDLLPTQTYLMNDMTPVFSGEVTFGKAGDWSIIELDEEFEYEGKNILVCINDVTGVTIGCYFYAYNTNELRSIVKYRDNTPYDLTTESFNTSSMWTNYCSKTNSQVQFTFGASVPSIKITPESIDLGTVRTDANFFTEKPFDYSNYAVTVKAQGGAKIVTNTIEQEGDFFKIVEVSPIPTDGGYYYHISYNQNGTTGEKEGTLVVTYKDSESATEPKTATIPLSAVAYAATEGEAIENPIEVAFTDNAFTHAASGMYDDYILPGEENDGNNGDAVYKFTLEEQSLITANVVEGTDPIVAIYNSDFGEKDGPSSDNNYEGIQEPSAPTTFGPYTFTTDGTELTNNFVNPGGWEHYAYGSSYIYTMTPSSYILTKTPFSITNDSKLTFTHMNVYSVASGVGYNVFISTDNVYGNADDIIVEECHVTAASEYKEVNLSEYAGKVYYIGFSYTNKTDDMLGIDDLALTAGSAQSNSQIDGVPYPAGTYYLVAAAAEGNFTLNLSISELTPPAAFALTAPEDNAREQNNPILAWEAAQYASSYNVYIGTSSDLSDVEPIVVTTNYCQTENLLNNTKYYWTVEAVNEQGTTSTTSDPWSFVTTLDVPQNISANPTQIYEGESTMISWSEPEHTNGFLYYNIYVNGELLEGNLEETSYEISGLNHNITGHEISVTAVYDGLGESGHAKCNVQVCGYGNMDITVKDGETPIKGATVVLNGTDELNNAVEEFTGSTNEAGVLLVENVKAGEYTVAVSKFGYEEKVVTGIVVESGAPYEATISMQEKPTAPEDLLKDDVAVEENYFDGAAIVTWTGASGITQKYNIYRRNVESGDVELVAEDQNNTYGTSKSYTDEDYKNLGDGTYQYSVTTDFKSGDEELLKEIFTQNPVTYSGWTQTYNNYSYYWKFVDNVYYYYDANSNWKRIYAYSGQSAFLVNDKYNTSPSSESTLVTKTLDLTGVSSPSLNFYYNNVSYKNFSNPIYVEVQVVGESTWSTLKTLNGTTNGWVNSGNIDLESYSDKQIMIRFRSAVNNSSVIGIDDVIVSKPIYSESAPVWSNEIKKGGIVFTNAGGDNRWDNENNWSNNTVPGAEDEVTIKATATISTNVNVKYLAISGGALTINKGATLTVTGELVNNDEYDLTINDGAQVFHNSENVKARFAMNIVAPETWSSENTDGWQFIAAPFVNNTAPIADFTSPNNSNIVYDLYKYNGVVDGEEWDNQKDNHLDQSWLYFNQGEGYLASYETLETATLRGTLNSGVTYSWDNLTYNNKDLANFHLVGNPFTFDMDITKATFTNMVNGVAIVTSNGGYDYSQTTIPVGDGFFVKTTADGAKLSYNHNAKSSRSGNANSLNITATGNAGKDNVVINFAGKSEGFNKLRNFNDAIATVYVQNEGTNYGIFNCDEDVQEIELCFNANQMGNYTISIEPNGKFQSVTLVDRFTGIETNMLLEDYSFTAMSNENNNRFILKLAVSDQQSAVSDNFVYQSGEELIVEAEGTVQIIDMMGRVVYNNDVTSDNNRINVSDFNNGAYVVRVINESEIKVEKVVIY